MDTTRFFHGTSERKAARIRAAGFTAGGETFLTDHRPLAEDYADVSAPAVLTVEAVFTNPLELDTVNGSVAAQLAAHGIPFEARGGYLASRTISALSAAGHDALAIHYPADDRDPSNRLPERWIVRAFDPARLTVSA